MIAPDNPPDNSRRPFWTHLPGASETAKVAAIALALGFVTAIIFSIWPRLDYAFSRLFLLPDDSFVFVHSLFWRFLREVFLKGFTAWYVLIVIGCFATWSRLPALFGLEFRRWLYLAACSLAGPLFLVNIVLKEHWGRWRPREIIQLGGNELPTAPLDWGGTCTSNCSFVSGEIASMVMVFISLAFVTTAWRPVFYTLAVVMGLVSAIMRIGQGGHFLSDALFAGVFMVLTAAGIYWLMFLAPAGKAAGKAVEVGEGASPEAAPTSKSLAERVEALWAEISRRGLAVLDLLFPKVK